MKVRLINCHEKLIPLSWQREYKLKLLEINGKTPALAGVIDIIKKDLNDFKKLARNVKLQLETKGILKDKRKVQVGKRKNQKDIIEIKASHGHSRLFAFFSDDKELIICTHTYWKTATNPKQQNSEFDKAASMKEKYIQYGE